MCGIIGYIGNRNVTSVLINSLKKLEYRGYDSAGIAVIGKQGLQLARCKGKISKLEQLIEGRKLTGKIEDGQPMGGLPKKMHILTRTVKGRL